MSSQVIIGAHELFWRKRRKRRRRRRWRQISSAKQEQVKPRRRRQKEEGEMEMFSSNCNGANNDRDFGLCQKKKRIIIIIGKKSSTQIVEHTKKFRKRKRAFVELAKRSTNQVTAHCDDELNKIELEKRVKRAKELQMQSNCRWPSSWSTLASSGGRNNCNSNAFKLVPLLLLLATTFSTLIDCCSTTIEIGTSAQMQNSSLCSSEGTKSNAWHNQKRTSRSMATSPANSNDDNENSLPDLTRVVAVSGQTIEFQCPLANELLASGSNAMHSSGATIIWRKDGHALTQLNSTRFRLNRTNSSTSLTIVRAQPKLDESIYECALISPRSPQTQHTHIDNQQEHTIKVHQFHLKLLVPPQLVSFEFPHNVQVGMKILLTCSALEGQQPISFVWLKDNQILEQVNEKEQPTQATTTTTSGSFNSKLMNETHTNSIVGATNNGGGSPARQNSLAALHRQQLADKFALQSAHHSAAAHFIQLNEKSAYVLVDGSSTALDNDDDAAELPTISSSFTHTNNNSSPAWPAASMHLRDSSVRIRQADDYSLLIIDPVELKHSGKYTCSAQNEAARTSHSSQLVINAPPVLVVEPKDGDLVSGQSTLVECAASGQPRPTISWLRAKEPSHANQQWDLAPIYDSTRFAILPNGSLAINNATQREHGFYMCTARNGFGPEVTKLIKITVHEPARLSAKQQLVETRVDERAQLMCLAHGEWPLSIEWLDKDGKRIEPSADDKQITIEQQQQQVAGLKSSGRTPTNSSDTLESRLVVAKATRADSAQYTCRAYNAHGHDALKLSLVVLDVADKVGEFRVANVTATSVALRWKLGYTGNTPVHSYLVQYQPDDPLDDLLMSMSSAPLDYTQLMAAAANNQAAANNLSPPTGADEQLVGFAAHLAKFARILGLEHSLNTAQQQNNASNSMTLTSAAINADQKQRLLSRPTTIANDNLNTEAAIDRTLVELSVEQTGTSVVVKDLSPFCVYRFRLAAINKIGLGEFTDWIRAKTDETIPAGAALKISASATGPNSIKLTWLPPDRRTWNGQLVRFQISYRPLESTFELNKSIEWRPPTLMQSILLDASNPSSSSGGNKTTGLEKSAPDALREHLRQLLAQQQHELVAHLTNLQRSTTYLVWIQAVNGRGAGPQSHAVSVKTLDDVPPSAPALRVQSTSAHSITLTWSMLSTFVSSANQYSLLYRRVPPPQHQQQQQPSSLINASESFVHPAHVFSEPGPFIERLITSQQLVNVHQRMSSGDDLFAQQQQQRAHQSNSAAHHLQQFVYTLDQLDCGTIYELYMTTRNSVGKSEPSAVVTTRTLGEPPLAPANKNSLFARIGPSDVLLNLASWSTGGCPLTQLTVRYKQLVVQQPIVAAAASSPVAPIAHTISWPVSTSVPSQVLASINLNSDQTAELQGGNHHRDTAKASITATASAQFALKNLLSSTSYELEISAHNSAGTTTAQYEFVTAGANGSRAGYTRREGVFRLDQRGQPLESNFNEQLLTSSSSLFANNDDDTENSHPNAGRTLTHPNSIAASAPAQLVPLALTLLCFVCLIASATFCYYRLADTWKESQQQRRRQRRLDGRSRRHGRNGDDSPDGMQSVCGADNSQCGARFAATTTTGSKSGNVWRARTLDESCSQQSASTSDSPASEQAANQMFRHFCHSAMHQQHQRATQQTATNSATLNPRTSNGSSSFSQSVSMKDFNLIAPATAAATLNYNARAADLSKTIGASATMARGRLFVDAPPTTTTTTCTNNATLGRQQHLRDVCQAYEATCKRHPIKQQSAECAHYNNSSYACHHQTTAAAAQDSPSSLERHETSWTTADATNASSGQHAPTSYAIPNSAYAQTSPNAAHQATPYNATTTTTNGDLYNMLPCSQQPTVAYGQTSAVDACIQHLMNQQQFQQQQAEQQQQYSMIVNQKQHEQLVAANDHYAHTIDNYNMTQLADISNNGGGAGDQSVVGSGGSSSSGIGADSSAAANHLDCANNSTNHAHHLMLGAAHLCDEHHNIQSHNSNPLNHLTTITTMHDETHQ